MNENQVSTFRENSLEGETNLNKPKLNPKLNLNLNEFWTNRWKMNENQVSTFRENSLEGETNPNKLTQT